MYSVSETVLHQSGGLYEISGHPVVFITGVAHDNDPEYWHSVIAIYVVGAREQPMSPRRCIHDHWSSDEALGCAVALRSSFESDFQAVFIRAMGHSELQ